MKVRDDIAELVRRGHTDASIAERVGCHRKTAARARRAMGYPPAHDLSRLYAEAVPTGRVRDWRPEGGRMPTSPAQQQANRERLLAALRAAA